MSKIVIKDRKMLDSGALRVNKIYINKLSENATFISIKNGKTKEGYERICNIMLDKENATLLREFLNA